MSLSATIETPSITYEQPIGLYIDGKWVKGKEGKTFDTINPSDEKPIVAVHEAGPDGMDVPSAIETLYPLLTASTRCRYCCRCRTKSPAWRVGRDSAIHSRSYADEVGRPLR